LTLQQNPATQAVGPEQSHSIFLSSELPLTTAVSESCGPPPRELDDDGPGVRTPISPSRTAQIALAWADKGWRVGPLIPTGRCKKPYLRGDGSTQAKKVSDNFRRRPNANVAIYFKNLGVVILDVDGQAGRDSLARVIEDAGVHLPATYTVRTGRVDGGQHLFFRIPPGMPPLVNQPGTGKSTGHAGLDVKFRGYVVGPGSIHESGALYTPSQDEVPAVDDLALLPVEVYRVLAAYGCPWVPRPRKKRRCAGQATALQESLPHQSLSGQPDIHTNARDGRTGQQGALVGRLLQNTADGRDSRTFTVVRVLVRMGWPDEQIKDRVLNSPLGAKAIESGNTDRYLQHKIDCAHEVRSTISTNWDPEAFWYAARTSGLPPAQVRILDHLLARSWWSGITSQGQDLIGINSATYSVSSAIQHLVLQP